MLFVRKHRQYRFLAFNNLIVFALVAAAFYWLWDYRQNDPLPAGVRIENFKLTTLDGKEFSTEDINVPFFVVFLNKKGIFSNGIYHNAYLNRMLELKQLHRNREVFMIVLIDTNQDKDEIKALLKNNKYKILENIVYLGYIVGRIFLCLVQTKRSSIRPRCHLSHVLLGFYEDYKCRISSIKILKMNMMW